jgi:hypothetical protein
MVPAVEQRAVSLTPACAAGGGGTRVPRTAPWLHRGLAVGALAAGLWLIGSLGHPSSADAVSSAALPVPAAAPFSGAEQPAVGAISAVSPAVTKPVLPATISIVQKVQSQKPGQPVRPPSVHLSPVHSGTAGGLPAASSRPVRDTVSAVIGIADSVLRSVPAVPVPTVPVLVPTVPVPSVPVLPLPVPTAPLPILTLPGSASPAPPGTVTQPAAGATAARMAITVRNHKFSRSAVRQTSIGRLAEQPAAPSVPTSPAVPPAPPPGDPRPGVVPTLAVGGSGNNPLDSGFVVPELPHVDATASDAWGGRTTIPPRQLATAPPVSPD